VESLLPYICLALAAFATTYVLTPVVKKIAIKLDAVDYPSKRRVNTVPTPRMGGLAVFAGLIVACALQIFGTLNWGWPSALVPHPSMDINYPMLGLSFLTIVATGALDDVLQLSPKAKLAGQVIAAMLAASSGLLIHAIVNPFEAGGEISLGFFAYPITIIYLVAYTNIINLIDGLDGLATGISAIAGCSMFSFAILAGRGDAAAISAALIGSCIAFLRYNFHPAKIFLGDSGSLLLGFALGSISLLSGGAFTSTDSVNWNEPDAGATVAPSQEHVCFPVREEPDLLTVRGGSVYFTTETGEELDITGQFSEAEPYVYSYTASDGSAHDIVIGGSLEDYGYMEYVYDAGGSFVGSAGILPTGYDSANSPPWLTAYEEARGLSF